MYNLILSFQASILLMFWYSTKSMAIVHRTHHYKTKFDPPIQSEVTDAFDKNLIKVDSMEADEITFAGYGEPLLRYEIIAQASRLIKEKHINYDYIEVLL